MPAREEEEPVTTPTIAFINAELIMSVILDLKLYEPNLCIKLIEPRTQ
jgi:hypothetical protein